MMRNGSLMRAAMTALSVFVVGCSLPEQNAKKSAPVGFITTPASYYSSPKARFLGSKYKDNLDRLVERIVRNPKTANLQFANNIASVGGIGFFTHTAAQTHDDRFLEVVLSAPETFEAKGDFNAKLFRIFSAYGADLLSILVSDSEIYQEKEVSGYGLNLSWRIMVPDTTGSRVALERAVIYFPKERARGFLHQAIDQNSLLAEGIIFAAEENGPLNILTYRRQDPQADTRLAIREESLAGSAGDAPAIRRPAPQAGIEAAQEATPPAAPKLQSASGKDLKPVAVEPAAESPSARAGAPKQKSEIALPVLASRAADAEKASASGSQGGVRAAALSIAGSGRQLESGDAQVGEKKPVAKRASKLSGGIKAEQLEESTRERQQDGSQRANAPNPVGPAASPGPGEKIATPAAKPSSEQIALQKNQLSESAPSLTKALAGYVIQLEFKNKGDALRWAETLGQRGFVVSVTEAKDAGAVRVRLGNFLLREEGERQLKLLRQEGLSGIVVNLPQAYRPELTHRAPDDAQKGSTRPAP